MGLVRITSWYPNFNGSHFGLPPSVIHRMTGLPPKIVWTMTYSHRPHSRSFWCRCCRGGISSSSSLPTTVCMKKKTLSSSVELDVEHCYIDEHVHAKSKPNLTLTGVKKIELLACASVHVFSGSCIATCKESGRASSMTTLIFLLWQTPKYGVAYSHSHLKTRNFRKRLIFINFVKWAFLWKLVFKRGLFVHNYFDRWKAPIYENWFLHVRTRKNFNLRNESLLKICRFTVCSLLLTTG